MPLGLGGSGPFFHPLITQQCNFPPPHMLNMKKDEYSRASFLYNPASHHQNHPYGPSHNQTSQQTSPLLFLNETLQKQSDLVQGFSARGGSPPPPPILLHQQGKSTPKASSSTTASDSKDESPADRNASPLSSSQQQSPNARNFDDPNLPDKKKKLRIFNKTNISSLTKINKSNMNLKRTFYTTFPC